MNYISDGMTVSTLRVDDDGNQVWRVRTADGAVSEFMTSSRADDPADVFAAAQGILGIGMCGDSAPDDHRAGSVCDLDPAHEAALCFDSATGWSWEGVREAHAAGHPVVLIPHQIEESNH